MTYSVVCKSGNFTCVKYFKSKLIAWIVSKMVEKDFDTVYIRKNYKSYVMKDEINT